MSKLSKSKKLILNLYIVIVLIIFAMALMGIYGYNYFSDKWYVNTFLNETNISRQSLSDTISEAKAELAGYTLTVTAKNEKAFVISASDIDLTSDIEELVSSEFEKQHEKNYISSFFQKRHITTESTVYYSDEKLSALIDKLDIMNENIIEPVNAKVVFNSDKQCAEIEPEVYGTKINKEELLKAVKNAVDFQKTELNIAENEEYPEIYYQPEIKKSSTEMNNLLYDYNKNILHWINWNIGEGTVRSITPEDLMDWTVYDEENMTVSLDEDKLSKWVENTCYEFKTVGKTRTFTTHSGGTTNVSGGDYGWQMDYSKMLELTLNAVKDVNNENMSNYTTTFSDEAKQLLTTDIEPVYKQKGYNRNLSNLLDDWDHDNYTEISLSEQMVYVFRDGQMVFSTPCITGKPTPERTTTVGTYYLKERRRDKTLVGEDYETPVSYWYRITWTGIGFHDATWQNWSAWNNQKYKTVGSHGCINLSMESVKKIYELLRSGDPVFVYW